jgi:hypothetical protein
MTAITTLRNAIAKHPADSEVARLLSWAELTMGDLHDRIYELEAEIDLLREDKRRRCTALNETRALMSAISDYILKENFDMPMDTFAKDYAPWRNIMAAHGVEPYAKPKRAKKAA